MEITNNPFRATLVTTGRKTGKPHSVMLRGVMYKDKIYFSRHRPNSDWFQNAISHPEVTITYKDFQYLGIAKKVIDEKLNNEISRLKYPGEKRADEKRVAIEITLHEQLS